MLFFSDCSTVIGAALSLVASAPSCSQTCCWRAHVLPGASKVLSGALRCSQTYHSLAHGTSVPVIRDPRYYEGRPECPPRVWYSPEIDTYKFTLHILSDTPGGFQWLKYILLMVQQSVTLCNGFNIWSMFFWSIWVIQQWWRIVTTKNVTEMTPGRSYLPAPLLAGIGLYMDPPPKIPNNWG